MTRNKIHFLSIKGSFYLEDIINGKKIYEGRVFSKTCKEMNIGDFLKLYEKEDNWGIICEITSLDVYQDFKKMLLAKGIFNLLPRLKNEKIDHETLLKKGIKIYESFKGSNRVHKLKAIAIGVKFIKILK